MFNTKRTLIFTQIVDSRFCDNPETEIKNRIAALNQLLASHDGLVYESEKIKRYTADDGDFQYRITFYVQKKNRKVIWDDIYRIVNSVKPVPFNFANMPIIL